MSLQALILKMFFRYSLAYFNRKEPSVDDWRAMFEKFSRLGKLPKDVRTHLVTAGGVPAEWITTPGIDDRYVHIHLHGGAYFIGSVKTFRDLIARVGRAAGMRSLGIDYRLAPEHPFPAALEDAVCAYRWLLAEGYPPQNIIMVGDSSGGGLALSTLVKLRDEGSPLPAGLVCLSPWTDLALTGDSYKTKAKVDPINKLSYMKFSGPLYAGDYDLTNPQISPLYADLSGLPPLLIQVGTEETLLDDSTRLAARAKASGVDVTLEIWEGMVHVFQSNAMILPEARRAIEKIGQFMRSHIGIDHHDTVVTPAES